MKGADVVMAGIVQYNDWLEEEVQPLVSTLNVTFWWVQCEVESQVVPVQVAAGGILL